MGENLRLRLLGSELVLFAAISLLGIFVGTRFFRAGLAVELEAGPSLLTFMIAFAIATALIILMLKFIKFHLAFQALFVLLIFVGAQIVFGVFFGDLIGLGAALVVIGTRLAWPSALTQNIAIGIAVSGVGARLGTMFSLPVILVLLLVFSVYDIIAVFKTKHMQQMFKGLLQRGVMLSIVIPERPSYLGKKVGEISAEKLREKGKKNVFLLGTGDLVFPILFAVAALPFGIFVSLATLVGALVGMATVHFIFVFKKPRVLPALPPIAGFSALGFGLAILVQILF